MVHSQELGPTITAALDDGPLRGTRIVLTWSRARFPRRGPTCRSASGDAHRHAAQRDDVVTPQLAPARAPRVGRVGSADRSEEPVASGERRLLVAALG